MLDCASLWIFILADWHVMKAKVWQHGTVDAVHDVEHVYQVAEVGQLQGMKTSSLPKFREGTDMELNDYETNDSQ